MLAFLLSSLEHRCAGSSDCGEVLEYIEPMCIEAHLEAHVLDLYIPTHLGLEEYSNISRQTPHSAGSLRHWVRPFFLQIVLI